MTINVNLEYYDGKHRKLLTTAQPYASVRTAARVQAFKTVSTIRKVDFLSYFLIHRQSLAGYQTFQDLQGKISTTAAWVQDVLRPVGPTLQLSQPFTDAGLAERVGEAVGLSVISRLHQLTDADWTKLDTLPGVNGAPTFDFEIASDSVRIIQVETKGSFVANNTLKPSAVGNHAASILKKKTDIPAAPHYPYPASVRYGTITVLDDVHEARCWLLDPPADVSPIPPADLRIMKRLAYTAKLIALIAPKASLVDAIVRRIEQIRLHGSEQYNGRTLTRENGHAFSAKNYAKQYLAKNKLYVEPLDAVGKLLSLNNRQPIFIG